MGDSERYLLIDIILKYLVVSFFKDKTKAVYFMNNKNKNLSENLSPRELILAGKAHLVWDYVLSAEYDRARK